MTPPLVPADVTIPRLPWVPIYADRLWSSDFFAVATDAEFKAAFCLWLKSWTQRPPGSLPNDDRLLCRLAELGGNLAKWGKVKRIALRHWVLCDDDRLYHPVVAEFVLDAYNKLNTNRARTSAATAARWKTTKDDIRNVVRNGHDIDIDIESNLKGRSLKTRAREARRPTPKSPPEGGDLFLKNGGSGAAAPPPPLNPKILGHSLPCSCANCTRWAEQHAKH